MGDFVVKERMENTFINTIRRKDEPVNPFVCCRFLAGKAG
jgi:hypothetical protein